ncbi:MAG: type 4a pilus biogenesis protein PilO, partial [Elusimicrobiaceae bacterium]|nr:type 4a pilus biogenesis protein PilO [Elusimicrobiaceae bacterium]
MAEPQTQAKKAESELIKTVVAVILFTGVCGFLYFRYVWKPFSVRIEAAETKISQVDSDIALAHGTAKRLDKITEEIAKLKVQQEAAEKRLPRSKDIPGLIKSVVEDSRRHKVFLSVIAPGPSVNKAYYTETNYELRGSAAYRDLGHFLNAISGSMRIFNVKNLSVN